MATTWCAEYATGVTVATGGFPKTPAGTSTLAAWVQAVGPGTIVLSCEGGAVFTRHCNGGEIYCGSFTALTTNGCQYVVMGNGAPPPPSENAGVVNLAGGAGSVTGVLPATNVQNWSSTGTIYATGFTPTMGAKLLFAFPASGDIYFPAITAALDGNSVALGNCGTGATATVLHGVLGGTANVGLRGVGATSGTSAGPSSLQSQTYTADLLTNTWIQGI